MEGLAETVIHHKFPVGATLKTPGRHEAQVLAVSIDGHGGVGYLVSLWNHLEGVFHRHNVLEVEMVGWTVKTDE